jgi:hypothetical protein
VSKKKGAVIMPRTSFAIEASLVNIEKIRDMFIASKDAYVKTLKKAGHGIVFIGRRKKIRAEKRKPPHNKLIYHVMKKNGMDPFDYPMDVVNRVQREIDKQTMKALIIAFETGVSQEKLVRIALFLAAGELTSWVQRFMGKGGFGKRTLPTDKKKRSVAIFRFKRDQGRGLMTKKYGGIPPKGIYSGRFVESIVPKWRKGQIWRGGRK